MSERELGQETAPLEAVASATDPPAGVQAVDQPALLGRTLAGRFKLIRFLGRGGMGEVYEARDFVLQTTVAVKTLTRALADNPSAIERLRREVLLARRVAHPNVCRIHELHEDRDREGEGLTFISMELLDGETLAAQLGRSAPLPRSEALPLLEQLAAGLGAIHQQGLVHRDFKPGNVMLVRSEESIRAIVMDFGIARALHEPGAEGNGPTLTDSLGTPRYMAPEQLRGGEIGPRTDVYALALVAREMVTGPGLPMDAPAPRVPRGWKGVLRRGTSERPADRQPSPAVLVRALRRAGRSLVAVPIALALITLVFAGARLAPGASRLARRTPVIPSSSARLAVVPVGTGPATGALADALRTELSLPGAVRSNREEEGWPTVRNAPATDVGSPSIELLEGLRSGANSSYALLTSTVVNEGASQVELALYRTSDGHAVASTQMRGAGGNFPELANRAGAWTRSALGLPVLSRDDARRLQAAHPSTLELAERLASARTMLQLARPGEALPLLEEVVNGQPAFAPALADFASALSGLGRRGAAREARARAARAATSLPELLRVRIEREYWKGLSNSEEQKRSEERLYQLTPDEASAILAPRGRGPAPRLAEIEALRTTPNPVTLDPMFDSVEATQAISQGKLAQALAAIERGEAKLAGYEDRHRRLKLFFEQKSVSLRFLHRFPEALATETAAIEIQKADDQQFALAQALELNAFTLHDLRQWSAAVKSARHARDVWSASGADLGFNDELQLAQIVADNLLHLGDADQASEELVALLARHPDGCPVAQSCQSYLSKVALARGQMSEARTAAAAAEKLGEEGVYSLFDLAFVEGDLSALESASKSIHSMEENQSPGTEKIVLQLPLEDWDILDVQLAEARLDATAPGELETFQLPRLRTDEPGSRSALLRLESRLVLARGKSTLALPKAEAALEAALRFYDGDLEWDARLQLARVLYAVGQRGRADETVRPLEEIARHGGHKLLAMQVTLVKVEGLPRGRARDESARRLEREASRIGYGRIAKLARGLLAI